MLAEVAKGENGKSVVGSSPYGYLKDSNDKNKWIVDEAAEPIVRRIFIENDISRFRLHRPHAAKAAIFPCADVCIIL